MHGERGKIEDDWSRRRCYLKCRLRRAWKGLGLSRRITLVYIIWRQIWPKKQVNMCTSVHTQKIQRYRRTKASFRARHTTSATAVLRSPPHKPGLGRVCNENVCVLGSDLTWWQHIMLSNSWSSRCPFCDQPLLPCGRCGHVVFDSFVGRDCWGIAVRKDFFSCNGRGWPWCGGDEGIDGIGWRCHRPQGFLSSRTMFRRGWTIVFYDMSKFCGWWHFKILNDPCSTWSLFSRKMGGTSF